MQQFGAFKAKTHFSELLAEVMRGKKFIITKRGVKVAMIIPFKDQEGKIDPVEEAIDTLKALRKGITLGKETSIRKMIEEGRK
jgi:prevent-host-death family protein